MLIDALIIALISTTEFRYEEDCDTVGEHTAAYHRVTDHWSDNNPEIILYQTSLINLCEAGMNQEVVTHELGHELHHRVKNDPSYDELLLAWDMLYVMSDSPDDHVTNYATTNYKEDFAETFEHLYSAGLEIPEVTDSDWISAGVSEKQVAKFQLMKIIVIKYSNSLQ